MTTAETTVITTAIGAAVTLGLAYIGYLKLRLAQKATTTNVANVASRVEEVHTLANNLSDTQNARIDQLTASLTAKGIDVPPREALQ
jgi:hypothetical protein